MNGAMEVCGKSRRYGLGDSDEPRFEPPDVAKSLGFTEQVVA